MEKALNDSTSIIVPSFSIKKDLLSWFNLDNNTIHVIEHGNSLPQGKFKKIKTPYFLSFGTIEPRKNLDFYSEAIKKSRLNKIFEFIHVGRIGWGTLPSVFTHVRATDQELADLIYNSQCVVIPSHYEGFGLPVLEAHYNEKHTIMSNDPALTELKLKSDLVFELGNLDSLIDQLKYAAINQLSLTQEEIQSTHRYSWNRSIKKHLEIYRKYCV
jgi:glycosyltransferase involved in cell wall biosynthesis